MIKNLPIQKLKLLGRTLRYDLYYFLQAFSLRIWLSPYQVVVFFLSWLLSHFSFPLKWVVSSLLHTCLFYITPSFVSDFINLHIAFLGLLYLSLDAIFSYWILSSCTFSFFILWMSLGILLPLRISPFYTHAQIS
jgi:hypothetical protein